MHLNRLDLNLLVVLDALLTEKNVTKASKLIHLSQPATSGSLSRLREYFGDDLLVRIGSKMVLTPLGESLAIPVNNILLQIQATVENRPEFDPMQSDRNFNFMLSDYTNAIFVPKLLQGAYDVAPNVKFEFTQLYDAPQEALEKGKIDFLLLPEFALSSNHPSCLLFSEDYVCVGDKNNAALDENFSLERFLNLGHVTTKFGTQLQSSLVDTILEERNIKINVEVVTPSFTSIPQVIVGTNRIAVMHRRLAAKWSEYVPLKVVPVPFELPTMNWGLQWHQYRQLDPGTMWMKKLIVETVKLL
jgi:LysR family transcriptional regulator, nod-box dependent transcriptional activator